MTRHRAISRPLALGCSTALSVLFVCASVATGQSPVDGEERVEHLRPLDAHAATILREGLAHSATLRQLAAALENSDLVVYIRIAQIRIPSRLSFMTATSRRRLALISLDFQNLEPSMTGWLGHELQHAVELAGAPEVRSREDLDRLYRRIGEESSSGGWCTRAAQKARSAVLDELLANSRASR